MLFKIDKAPTTDEATLKVTPRAGEVLNRSQLRNTMANMNMLMIVADVPRFCSNEDAIGRFY